jgi:DNA-binding SARP family transcriptional activator
MPKAPQLAVMVAAAGYGKSTALDAAAPRDGLVCSAREALDTLDDLVGRPWLGIDDVHELEEPEQRRLLMALDGMPDDTRAVVTSRHPLRQDHRALLRGRTLDRGPADLALDAYAVRRVLVDEYSLTDPELPVAVHAVTGGWPALVHFAAELLAAGSTDLSASLMATDGPAAAWIRREVLALLPSETREVLSCLHGVGPTTERTGSEVARALGHPMSAWPVTELLAAGLLVRLRGIGREGLVQAIPAVAGAARAETPPQPAALAALTTTLVEDRRPFGAARAAAYAGDWVTTLDLLATRGDEMVRHGHAAGVVELVESAPHDALTDDVRRVHGLALCTHGDLSAAARAYRPLSAAADDPAGPGSSAALASGLAMLAYARGDLEGALSPLARVGDLDEEPATDAVELLAWRVHVLCSLGRREEAVATAGDALARAEASGESVALAAGHLALARVSAGQRKEAHHELAVRALHASGDVVTAARAHVNHSCHLLAAARYEEAARSARAALQAADVDIAAARRAYALCNLSEALVNLGAYDEATWHLDRALALFRRLGAGRIALCVLGLAEVDRQLGRDERARSRYVEAADLAREAGEPEVLVQALAGLACLPDVGGAGPAEHSAEEATRLADGWTRPVALTAAAWVAFRRADLGRATALAEESIAAAREERAAAPLADALELAAVCETSTDAARRLLTEALSVWEAGGASPRAHRVAVLLGRLEDADCSDRSRARAAARELQRLGVSHVHGVPVSARVGAASVAIEVLGGFRVSVDGVEVPVTAWRSRQARTLIKILAARHGRPASRSWLCETLWPDDDPAKTGHRLSVLLTTVRGVLDPDRRWPPDRFVVADLEGIWLDRIFVTVDAVTLVHDATSAAALMDAGETDRAEEILADVNDRYRGDAFEDEQSEAWADGAREEVRAAWQRSVRRLAALVRRAGRVGDAQGLMVRLLSADPYDERIHELLVRSLLSAGRRGEARRAFDRWRVAMHDIGAPEPDPAIFSTCRTRRSRAAHRPTSCGLGAALTRH